MLLKYHITHARYDSLVGKILKSEPLPADALADMDDAAADAGYDEAISAETGAPKKLPVNQKNLKKTPANVTTPASTEQVAA